MKEKFEKYAELLLKRCLNLKEGEPLLIEAPIENYEFIRLLNKKALEMGVSDIHIEWYDDELKHDTLKYLTEEEIENHPFWNKKIFDEYASKNAAFLMLNASDPDIMNDIDPKKVTKAGYTSIKTRPIYKRKQNIYEVSWCIAATSTLGFSKKVFPKSDDPVTDLWNQIFEICFINTENPIEEWEKQVIKSENRSNILNKYKFKMLHYTNSLGTDLKIGLTDKTIWCGAGEKNLDGRKILVNLPTFEVFTSPDKNKTNGVVYSSKPLVYNGTLIENIRLEFKDGKVVNFDASKGKDVLEGIIKADENSCMLGEAALVDYNSPISNSNIIFYTTLYDENAACHLALGNGFKTALENGVNLSLEELDELGLNNSVVHVDFMIGTKDLCITGIDSYGNEKEIFKDGNFVLK